MDGWDSACGLRGLRGASRLRPPKCGSARSVAFTEGFGFRCDGMVMLALLVTNGADFRLIANDRFRFVHLRFFCPPHQTRRPKPRLRGRFGCQF